MNAHVPASIVDRIRRSGVKLPLRAEGAALVDADNHTIAPFVPLGGSTVAAHDVAQAFADLANLMGVAPKSYAALDAGFACSEAV